VNPFAAPYLYGLDAPPPREAVEAYVTALVVIARADGIVESEGRIIQGVADILGAPPFTVSRALEECDRSHLDAAVETLKETPYLLDLLYRDALLVVRADGHQSSQETEFLLRLSAQLGLSRARRARASEAADLFGSLRQAMIDLVGDEAEPTVVAAVPD